MKPKKLLSLIFSLSALLLLSACDGSDGADTVADSVPVSFSAKVEGTTGAVPRAATSVTGEMTTDNIPSMGVYAYYTGVRIWSEIGLNIRPNFMLNQKVEKQGSVWTYSPMKYWPGIATDKISFFAYAPHAMPTGTGILSPGEGVYCIRLEAPTGTTGAPIVYYRTPAKEKAQIDLLAADALLDRTRSGNSLSFGMKHVLAKVEFRVKSSSDIQLNMLKLVDIYNIASISFEITGTMKVETSKNVNDSAVDVLAYLNNGTMDIEADKETKAATFYLPAGKPETAVLSYTSGGTTEEKTMELPGAELWQPGQHVIYTIVIDKIKLDISVNGDNKVGWESGGDPVTGDADWS